jgi:hypothetical protein
VFRVQENEVVRFIPVILEKLAILLTGNLILLDRNVIIAILIPTLKFGNYLAGFSFYQSLRMYRNQRVK